MGTLPDGRVVRRVRLTAGGATLDILDLGAAVDGWLPAGADRSVVLGFNGDIEQRWRNRHVYPGVVCGRYLSRIRDGRFNLGGAWVQLATNDHGHTLHGGPDGFDLRTWEFEDVHADTATLRLHSPDGDQGFPGALTARVTYRLRADEVAVELHATTDAPTVVGLGSHPYFDVGANPLLTVPAESWIPVDEEFVARQGAAPVHGTSVDARTGLRVGPHPMLDFSYLVDGVGLRPMAGLAGDRGALEIAGDQPALQVFTGGALGGVALEVQREPNGPNRPDALATLHPGGEYRSTTHWTYQP